MLVQIFLALAFIPTCRLLTGPCTDTACTSKEYQKEMKQGFDTNWFKTKRPFCRYDDKMIKDVVKKNFHNIRLRCDTEFFDGDYTSAKFNRSLDALEHVVDKCLDAGLYTIITWFNKHDEQHSTGNARKDYVNWWKAVANRMKSKNYRLSFNLYEELSETRCKPVGNCTPGAIYDNPKKYNRWTSEVVKEIRGTGENNAQRILILSSPNMTADGLKSIDKSIYENDKYMMAEFHLYATGPSKHKRSKRFWDGMEKGHENVNNTFEGVEEFSRDSGLYTYFAEWQPNDHRRGRLNQTEVLDFAKYFLQQIRSRGIPWSLNAIHRYYDTRCYPAGECNCRCNDEIKCTKNRKCNENKKCGWFTTPHEIELKGINATQTLDVQEILETIKQNM